MGPIDLVIMTVQGWSSVIPKFSAVDFVSLYLEYGSFLLLFLRR